MTSRTLANGSYDGWVFGDPNTPAPIDDSSNTTAPTPSQFQTTNSTNFLAVLNVPEPCAPALLGLAFASLASWKRKARA
jgi:hypothetical protein